MRCSAVQVWHCFGEICCLDLQDRKHDSLPENNSCEEHKSFYMFDAITTLPNAAVIQMQLLSIGIVKEQGL